MDSEQLKTVRRRIANTREELNNTILQQLRVKISPQQLRANDLAKMRGASSWLTTLPLKSKKFDLNKREIYDVLSLRYRWTRKYLPSTFPCGKRFDVDHAMSCMKGGFVHRRHDDVRDLFASLLKDVCHDAEVGPDLQPLTGEVLVSSANSSDEARLDVSACGFWQRENVHFLMLGFLTRLKRITLTRNLTRLSRAMRTRKSDTTTSELLKSSRAPSALSCSCSHHMVETAEKPSDFLGN